MTGETQEQTKRVLVALDGSPAAATALPVARAVAAQLHAALEVLVVGESGTPEPSQSESGMQPADAAVRRAQGEPATAILKEAQDPAVALIVLTTHGRTIEAGRGLGHIAETVIRGAERPILLVRPEAAAHPEAPFAGIRRLLAPMDGTPSTAVALRPITALASQLHAALDLLYVVDASQATPAETGTVAAPRYVDQPQHEWPHWANEAVSRLANVCAQCPPDVPVQMYLTVGDAGDEVMQFIANHDEDAIVLVRKSKLEAGRGRILRSVLERAPCPILLVGGTPD